MTLAWTQRSNPFEAVTPAAFASGYSAAYGVGKPLTLWTPIGNAFDDAGTNGYVADFAWSSSLMLWVAVGSDGTPNPAIMTSPDGVNWTQTVTNPFTAGDGSGYINAVIWVDDLDLFFAFGSDGGSTVRIATSADGMTWSAVVADPFGPIAGATAGAWSSSLGRLVVVGQNSTNTVLVGTSPDGVVWTPRTTPWDFPNLSSPGWVDWSPDLGLFAIAGFSNLSQGPAIMTSPTGVTWTERATPFDGNPGDQLGAGRVIWSPTFSKFYALGGNFNATIQEAIIESDDGIVWTAVPSPFDSLLSPGGADTIIDTGTELIVGGEQQSQPFGLIYLGITTIAVTADGGTTWSVEAAPTDANEQPLYGLGHSPDLGLTLAGTFNQTDASSYAYPATSLYLRQAPVSGFVIATGLSEDGRNTRAISHDAVTWYPRGSTTLAGGVYVVGFSPDLDVFVTLGGSEIAYSPDGLRYASLVDPPWIQTFAWQGQGLCWSSAQTLWVAVGGWGSGSPGDAYSIITSPDGLNWTGVASPLDVTAFGGTFGVGAGVTYSPTLDLWVAVGRDPDGTAIICTSPDATGVWTQQMTGLINNGLWAVTWFDAAGLFVAVGNGGTWTSPDGAVWTQVANDLDGGFNPLYGACDTGDLVVLVGANFDASVCIVESADGMIWVTDTSPFDANGSGQGANGITSDPVLAKAIALGTSYGT